MLFRSLLIVLLAVAVIGCGPRALTESDLAFADFEAEWLCDVQRYSYADLSEMDEARADLMLAHGVEAEDYRDFKDLLEEHEELRMRVADTYAATCGV